MEDSKKKYFEQSALWDKDYLHIPKERERIEEVIKRIPSETNSVLDVGCGRGVFVNTLVKSFPDRFDRVVALDPSEEALQYVNVAKTKGTIACLPFEDESFDLVTSLEVLEHLPCEDYKKGISELQRVSKKNIVITIPNGQELASSLVMCPKCYCRFSPIFHMRRFDQNSLQTLFEDFKLIEAKEIGPTVEERSYNPLLLALYRSWRSVKKSPLPEIAICPQCGYQHKKEFKPLKNNPGPSRFFCLAVSLFNLLIKPISPIKKKKAWLLALYERVDE